MGITIDMEQYGRASGATSGSTLRLARTAGTEETDGTTKPASSGGDVVSISEHGLKLSKQMQAASGQDKSEDAKSAAEQVIENLRKRMKEIEAEIQKLEASSMPDEVKQKLIEAKRSELVQIQGQLAEAQAELAKQSGGSGGAGGSGGSGGATERVRPRY
ncbi:hypothetical protein [Nitratidesulfovibrio vulgaris]|uniref:FlxA-like protein n=1 Tax=Nitratidesulfovibrio vulgaris (strain ATCC 29579 / DSM 644 / CCUG 34227 / NCIMB 8303 / VKM B-1760 / Hildenborough) TaxID=882 RepID=Q72WJ7_NITV2|nr:hypothetical protein [Nitratidesulfovibrio vulgaris]AAS94367.1 hypothetical protein DVUA0092 [Nitratidesulfovibrio vulgaris str. Hildenborough]ADP88327.1 hypothetical protein Deval_3186 [Nitratidesulfovibrio vulgaris RCH1]